MHYLVTGGCGFIGSHLVERLVGKGHKVTIIDDLSSGKAENVQVKATLITGDITKPGIFDKVIGKVDGCFHLAAIVSVQLSNEAWLRTHQVNVSGFVALLDALVRKKRKIPVVFASSAAVYGDSKDMPIKEASRTAPLSAYGVDKLACEYHAAVGAALHGIPSVGLRFFNVYGPRQDPSSPYAGVISIFASRMKQHLPITIYGDGEQVRDFIYVDDIVGGLTAAMQKLESKELTHGIFNLCTGVPISVNRLAALIAELTKSRSPIAYVPERRADIRVSLGDPALSTKTLGAYTTIAIQDGLERTLVTL